MTKNEWAADMVEKAFAQLGVSPSPHYEQAQNGFIYEGNRAILFLLAAILHQLVGLEEGLKMINATLEKSQSEN
jgi:hypothetical protein